MMRIISLTLVLSLCGLCQDPSTPNLTPGQLAIAQAQATIEKTPEDANAYSRLAFAYAKRARETADPEMYRKGLEAVERGLKVEPQSYENLHARIWLLLGLHEFAQARKEAMELQKRSKDDILLYGFLADANTELGNYKEAEEAAQWMLDMRPGNIPGLTRGAYLREIFGDLEGALEFMGQAYKRTPPQETEDRAWLLTHIAHLERLLGRTPNAEQAVDVALQLFPDYHYALGEKAKLAAKKGDWKTAARLYERRYEVASHPENLYDVANALAKAGEKARAKKLFAEFEKAAMAEMNSWDNSNRELISYWLEYAGKKDKALELAQKEIARRQDVQTIASYSWALHHAGKKKEAREQMAKVLAVGVRDPEILERARKMGVEPQTAAN